MLNRLYKKLSKVAEKEGYEFLSVRIGSDKPYTYLSVDKDCKYSYITIKVRKPCEHIPNTEDTYKYLTFYSTNGSKFRDYCWATKIIEGMIHWKETKDDVCIEHTDRYTQGYILEEEDEILKKKFEKYLVPKKYRSSNKDKNYGYTTKNFFLRPSHKILKLFN